jgi:hypothetical protein
MAISLEHCPREHHDSAARFCMESFYPPSLNVLLRPLKSPAGGIQNQKWEEDEVFGHQPPKSCAISID